VQKTIWVARSADEIQQNVIMVEWQRWSFLQIKEEKVYSGINALKRFIVFRERW